MTTSPGPRAAVGLRTWEDVERGLDFDPRTTEAFRVAQLATAIGDAVRAVRADTGQSQADLAKAMDVSQPAVARLERGSHVPTLPTLLKIAQATDCHLVVAIVTESELKDAQLGGAAEAGRVVAMPASPVFTVEPRQLPAEPGGILDRLTSGR